MIASLQQEMREVLHHNILSFWLQRMQDTQHGGFYGRIKGDGTLVADAPKGGILNARILWSFAAAYRVTGRQEYLEAATRAKDFILQYFIDREYGGTYWELDSQGTPTDTKKQFYSIAFTLYGMAEYARATGCQQALHTAIQLYEVIEQYALDSEHGGYIEALTRDWGPLDDVRLSALDVNYPKSQNTHLHILEAYTCLYRIWKDRQLEQSLRRLIRTFTDRIIHPHTHHLGLFFQRDWAPYPQRLESYGHDIECSFLLHEAAVVLGDQQLLSDTQPLVLQLAEASAVGIQPDGSVIHEANLDTGAVDANRQWWVQAENVTGWMRIYQLTHQASALQRALATWQYIKTHLIDYTHGEWYWDCAPDGTPNTHDDRAGFWKCPYHNTRMCLEVMSFSLL